MKTRMTDDKHSSLLCGGNTVLLELDLARFLRQRTWRAANVERAVRDPIPIDVVPVTNIGPSAHTSDA